MPKATFMSHSHRTENGSSSVPMAVAGDRPGSRQVGDLTVTATGSALTLAGIRSAMSLGLGPHIIMVAGISPLNLAGIGCRRSNGRRLGFPGMKGAAT
jgi:hypothetical protein